MSRAGRFIRRIVGIKQADPNAVGTIYVKPSEYSSTSGTNPNVSSVGGTSTSGIGVGVSTGLAGSTKSGGGKSGGGGSGGGGVPSSVTILNSNGFSGEVTEVSTGENQGRTQYFVRGQQIAVSNQGQIQVSPQVKNARLSYTRTTQSPYKKEVSQREVNIDQKGSTETRGGYTQYTEQYQRGEFLGTYRGAETYGPASMLNLDTGESRALTTEEQKYYSTHTGTMLTYQGEENKLNTFLQQNYNPYKHEKISSFLYGNENKVGFVQGFLQNENVLSNKMSIGNTPYINPRYKLADVTGFISSNMGNVMAYGTSNFMNYRNVNRFQLERQKGNFLGAMIGSAVPKTMGQVYSYSALGLAGTYFPTATSIYIARSSYKSVMNPNLKPEERVTAGVFGTMGLFGVGAGMMKGYGEVRTIFGNKAFKITPTADMILKVEKTSRQRESIYLKNEYGQYILGLNKNNEAISIGGESSLAKELKQETGLSLKDISGLRKVGKFVTPEETQIVYTGFPRKSLVPSSDIKKFISVDPERFSGITGRSKYNPTTFRVFSMEDFRFYRVRGEEAGVINYLESGQKPTWLVYSLSKGRGFFALQSRYDVPFESTKGFESGNIIPFTHGTTSPTILKNWYNNKEKSLKISSEFSKRGIEGLYVSVPSSVEKLAPFKVEETFSRMNKNVYLTRRIQKFNFNQPSTWFNRVTIDKGNYGMPKVRIRKAGTFYKWGKEDYLSYSPLSYVGIGTATSEEVSLGLTSGTRSTFLTMNEKSQKPINPTLKAKMGVEVERIVSVGTELKTKGRFESVYLTGKKIRFQPVEIVKEGKKLGTGFVGEEYNIVNKKRLLINNPSSSSKSSVKPNNYPYSSLLSSKKVSSSYLSIPKSSFKSSPLKSSYGGSKSSYSPVSTPYYSQPYSTKKSTPSYNFNSYKSGRIINQPKVFQSSKKMFGKSSGMKKPKSMFGGYGVEVRRFGKFKSIGSGLSYEKAVNLGRFNTATTLSRTFKLTGGKSPYVPSGYYGKPSKKGLLVIEKSSKALNLFSETGELGSFKKKRGSIF